MIILGFQGCGKSYISKQYPAIYKDIDIKDYRNIPKEQMITKYVDDICEIDEEHVYVLGNIIPEVMKELEARNKDFYAFVPKTEDERTKEILFGRYVLRKEQTPGNVVWIEKMKNNWNSYTSSELFDCYKHCTLVRMTPKCCSISDLIDEL